MTVGIDLLTLNLWNLGAPVEVRMQRARTWVGDEVPDLLVLQEVSSLPGGPAGWTQAHQLADAAGHEHVSFDRTWSGDDRDQGLAVVSTFPLSTLEPVALPEVDDDEPRLLQRVEVATPGGPLRVANTHLAWRIDDQPGRVEQAAAITHALGERHVPTVLAGDLNDVHGSPPLTVLTESGFDDVCGDDRPTFDADNPWTFQEELYDRRVDHVLVRGIDADPAEVVLSGDDVPPVSDHYGVRCTLRV
ncbi:MAG: endonuclease/exonuclease/phosphatase family protein [Nitriliruptorales bacterium]|nr:endonuclease/exonuclease/phosphatase family protein [Nitriliruptorales bacterium]